MGMGFPFPWDSHGNGNTNTPKMGMGMGRVHGNGYFSYVPKFPSVDSMRMESNKIYLFIYLKCKVTSLFCEQMYVCMLYVEILRLRQLSVCILNIIIV